jgi:hypothetical protein
MKRVKKFGPRYGFKRFSAGGGVPVSGGSYDVIPAQYPFPSSGGGDPGVTSNTNVNISRENVNDENIDTEVSRMRRGGKVKSKRVRGDGIVKRGKTRGKFV